MNVLRSTGLSVKEAFTARNTRVGQPSWFTPNQRLAWSFDQWRVSWLLNRGRHKLAGPAFKPARFTGGVRLAQGPNCLSWGMDDTTHSLQPGRTAVRVRRDLRAWLGFVFADDVLALLAADGLEPLTSRSLRTLTGGWAVAVFANNTGSYHLLRQDDDGAWSHKPGDLPAERLPKMRHAPRHYHCETGTLRFRGYYHVDPTQVGATSPLALTPRVADRLAWMAAQEAQGRLDGLIWFELNKQAFLRGDFRPLPAPPA